MKKRKFFSKRILTLALAGAMCVSLLSGCAKSNTDSKTGNENAGTQNVSNENAGTTTPSSESKPTVTEGTTEITYPLTTENKTLTVYMKDASSGTIGNWGNIEAFQVAMEKLGVTLEFIHPAVGSEADQFNLMIASNQYPDIILWDFTSTPMGMGQLINDGVLINMNDLIHQYAPNYMALLDSNESFKKDALSDDGEYLAFYSFTDRPPISSGPTIRGDLLEKYNLELPVTVDDWTEVMTALKEQDDAVKYPLTTGKNRDGSVWFDLLLPAYKTSNSFCLDDETGEVVYGPSTENYKEYLSKLIEWYNAGLIDPEFMSNDSKSMNAKLSDSTCVGGTLMLNYHIASITNSVRANNPTFEFEGATWPVLKEGDTVNYFLNGGLYFSGSQIAITKDCEDPVLATKMLDYFYSEEGNNLLCWGIEGKSYTVNSDGTKSYTDEIMNNPEGKTPQEAILKYSIPTYNFSNVILRDAYIPMVTTLPEQSVALERWLDADAGVNMHKITVAAENQADYNTIMNDVTTYVQEMYIRFVTGNADLNKEWETYVNTLNGMGLEAAVEFQKEAYSKYQAR